MTQQKTVNPSDKNNSTPQYVAVNYRQESISQKSERLFFLYQRKCFKESGQTKILTRKDYKLKLAVRM